MVIDFIGKLKGEVFPGGEGKDYPVVVGAGQMLPDFEQGLLGVSAGDEKTFKVKFPKDYHADDLAGAKVDFTINAHRVEAEILPPLDDEFAASFKVENGGMEQFRKDVRENMHREAAAKIKNDLREQVMNTLLDENPLQVPNALKHNEMHSLQREAMQRMNIKDTELAPSLDSFAAAAEKRVALGLLLRQVISDKGLKADDDTMRAHVEQLCGGYENPQDMIQMYMSNPQVMQQIEPMVVEQMAIDWIIENGKSKMKKVSFKEFMNRDAS